MSQPLELTVMMYHYIRDAADEAEAGSGIPGMPVRMFEAQLEELAQRHTFVTWQDVRMALQGKQSLPEAACLLTFDDGVRDHYINVFPILRKRNLSGLFFILARSGADGLVLGHKIHFLLAALGLDGLRDAIWDELNPVQRERFTQAEEFYRGKYPSISAEQDIDLLKAVLQRDISSDVDPLLSNLLKRHVGPEEEMAQSFYLTAGQTREMSAGGMHFGGHSHSHPWFDWIDAAQRKAEIRASATLLNQIEPGPWAFAYPYGGLSDDAPELLKADGFIAAFTTRTQLQHTNPYLIGRLDGEELASAGRGYA